MGVCTTDNIRRDDPNYKGKSKEIYISGVKPGSKREEEKAINNPIINPVDSLNQQTILKEDNQGDNQENQKIINSVDSLNQRTILKRDNQGNNQENQNDNPKIFMNGNGITKEPVEGKKISLNYDIMNSNNNPSQIQGSDIKNEPNIGIDSSQKSKFANNNSKDFINDNNYEYIDINKDNYLICPICKLYVTKVESVEYDSISNDFKIKYKCFCSEEKENYLHSIIEEEKPICKEHKITIEFMCQDCSTQFCEECRNINHGEHQIKNIINSEVIPEPIMNSISEKKDNFKGFAIFEKIFNFYNNSSPITKRPEIKPEKSENNPFDNGDIELNKLPNNISKKKNLLTNNIEKENQKKPENNVEIKNGNEEEINTDKKTDKLSASKISKNPSNKEENNINVNLNNDLNNNQNENLNNDLNDNQNKNLNNAGNENNVDSQNKLGKVNSIEQFSNKDNHLLIDEKPEVRIPNDSNEEKEPEQTNININIINNEINPFKNRLNAGKNEEHITNPNQENSVDKDFNNNFNDENNNNIIDNKENGFSLPNINKNDNDIVNHNIDNSINKIINNGMNNVPDENINKNDNNNNIKDISSKDEKNENNLASNNNNDEIFNIIYNNDSYNNKEVLKNFINTKILEGHEDRIVCLIRLSSGYIATGSYDFSVKIWDITKDPKEALIATKFSVGIIFCLLELKPNELLAGNAENCIDVFDLTKNDIIEPEYRLFGHSLWITALVKCDEGHFASSSNDAKIFIWDSHKKNKVEELLGHTDCILTMILLEDGNLCSGSADNTIRIWDWKKGKCLCYFKAHNNWVKAICQFNNQILLSGSDDKKIKIWNINLEFLGKLEGHKHSVRTFCKIDDNYFASGSFDHTIKIWDFNEKKCINTLEGHSSNVICIIKYDDKLISCSNDKTIRIWEEEKEN